MLRLTRRVLDPYKFVDQAYLKNQRPRIPGGAWPVEFLRDKSTADLRDIWFMLLKEKNKLLSMKRHYEKHYEDLGAWPGPSRLDMVDTSMGRIRQVMRERHLEAQDVAEKMFMERLRKGAYRYPPGPPEPHGAHVKTSKLAITMTRRVSEDRLRELFSLPNNAEDHRGIVSISLDLTPAAYEKKEAAEQHWEQWVRDSLAYEEYSRFDNIDSHYDYTTVELMPGQPYGTTAAGEGGATRPDDATRASNIPVPEPMERLQPPSDPLERFRWQDKGLLAKFQSQLIGGTFPNVTTTPPEKPSDRPMHPDEIDGPWLAEVVYDTPDGAQQAHGFGVTKVDGSDVVTNVVPQPPVGDPAAEPACAVDPIYQEAVRKLEAFAVMERNVPYIPEWSKTYEYRPPIVDVVAHNYSNVADYVEREVNMTGRSIYEAPIPIDHTCGLAKFRPPWAKKPTTLPEYPMQHVNY